MSQAFITRLREQRHLALANGTGQVFSVNAIDELLDFLVGQIPAHAWADFKTSDQSRQRVWALIAKEKETGLLPEEKIELDDYLKIEHLLVLAKARARGTPRHD